jgi:hypothetical protein
MIRVKLYKAAFIGLLMAAMPATSSALVSPAPTNTGTNTQKLENLKTKGAAEIDRRLTNLNEALAKLDASTTLKPADKSALDKTIAAELTGLKALKAKLAADSDLTTARTDVQSIFTDYRVYYLMLPKTRMISAADKFDVVETKLTKLEADLQAKVTAAKAAGQDVTAMQKLLDDMLAKDTDATTKTQGVVTPLLALQPADFNSNHTVLLQYRTTMAAALTDLQASRADAASVIAALKTPKTSSSPTASPAASTKK